MTADSRPAALIVEDSPRIMEVFEGMAQRAGLEVAAKADTEDGALRACEAGTFSVAIVDLQLAQGTGFGVIRKLRERGRGPCAIIVCTNHAVAALKVAAFEAGADYFVDKCKDLVSLEALLRELIQVMAA